MAWLLRTRRADVIVPGAFFASSAVGFAAFKALNVTDVVVGLVPIAFMLLVLIRAYRANLAQRDKEASDIGNAHSRVRQCVVSLSLVDEALSSAFVDYRVYLALGRLASMIRLFVTRYGRYLSQDAAWAVLEAENLIQRAELGRVEEIRGHMLAVERQIRIIGDGIADVDDPGLRDARSRI